MPAIVSLVWNSDALAGRSMSVDLAAASDATFHDVARDGPSDATLMRPARRRSGQENSKQQRGGGPVDLRPR
jgi:hypothetical protein